MLLGAKVLKVEVGRYKYEMEKARNNPALWTGIGGISVNSLIREGGREGRREVGG